MPPHRDSAAEILVFGCGRWFCRDDQVGLLVAQALEKRRIEGHGLSGVRIITSENPGADLPGCLTDECLLIIVDAAAADETHPPGTWQRIDAIAERDRIHSGGREGDITHLSSTISDVPFSSPDRAHEAPGPRATRHRANTHTISVDIALDLAADLGVLPEAVWVYAIAIAAADRGDDVTPAVERAASEVTKAIATNIRRWQTAREQQHA